MARPQSTTKLSHIDTKGHSNRLNIEDAQLNSFPASSSTIVVSSTLGVDTWAVQVPAIRGNVFIFRCLALFDIAQGGSFDLYFNPDNGSNIFSDTGPFNITGYVSIGNPTYNYISFAWKHNLTIGQPGRLILQVAKVGGNITVYRPDIAISTDSSKYPSATPTGAPRMSSLPGQSFADHVTVLYP